MATVYLATDSRLDRTVALKAMHPELARHDEFVSRFIREAKTAARLTHPNIVSVFDQATDGRHVFLVMEYVPGCTLRELLATRGRFTPREALDILAPMLSALGAAHRGGMVHRDVKPENVLIAEEGAYSHAVKVADFGLARSAAAGATVSMAGMIVGTASYLAPEQVRSGVCDARSDVYSAGIVLFELLTGAKPFTGDSPIQIAYRHVHDRVPAPSTLVPGLDPALDALVVRATDQDPESRHADANSFHADLNRVFSSLPDSALDFGAVNDPNQPDQVATREMKAVAAQRQPNPTKIMPTTAAEPTRPVSPNLAATDRPATVEQPIPKPAAQPAARSGMEKQPPPKPVYAPRKSPNDPYRVLAPGKKRRLGRGDIALIFILAVALLVGALAWWVGVGRFRAMPGLARETQTAALAELSQDGLKAKVTQVYDENVPTGHVIKTSPDPAKKIARGATVEVLVSRGPRPVAVPGVGGRTQADATTALQRSGFVVVLGAPAYSDTIAPGVVVSQAPTGTAQPGSPVTLTVSQGQQAYPVPDVTGLSADDAKAKLAQDGFTNVTVSGISIGDGAIGSQDPAAGATARHQDPITIRVKFLS